MASTDTLTQRSSTAHTPRAGTSRRIASGLGVQNVPRTPLAVRSASGRYGSPRASDRSDEEATIFAIGCRHLEAGLAGEHDPRAIIRFSPGLFSGRSRPTDDSAGTLDSQSACELYTLDTREENLGLVQDKLELALRKVFNEDFMLDLKGRKAILTVPARLPDPLLNVITKAVFESSQQPPSVTLITDDLAAVIASGLRSALVIDIGWHETSISAIYEYRRVAQQRTRRAMKMLNANVRSLVAGVSGSPIDDISFATCEQIVERLSFCPTDSSGGSSDLREASDDQTIPLSPSTSITLSLARLSNTVQQTFFPNSTTSSTPRQEVHDHHDDDLTPLATLAHKVLTSTPHDVRGTCISRILIVGGGSQIPGLRHRLLSELNHILETKRFDPVHDYGAAIRSRTAVEQVVRFGNEFRARTTRDAGAGAGATQNEDGGGKDGSAAAEVENLTLLRLQHRKKKTVPVIPPDVRGVQTLGSWSGASIMGHLRVQGAVELRRDEFARFGLGGRTLGL